jgi:DNA-binding PadR family transcriptional regulator
VAKEAYPRPYEVIVYTAMKDGPAYGYQLAAYFRRMTGGHIKISYGTIYPLLRKMERNRIIRSRRDGESGRVYYELTERGLQAEKAMIRKMTGLEKDMEEKLLGGLCMHSQLFGRKALRNLLGRANRL